MLLEKIDHYHKLASEVTELSDFGSDNYREAMALYLGSLDADGKYGEIGQSIADGMMVGLLSGRLLTNKGIKAFPDSQKTPIRRPIFIVGLTRTGTTVLHRLISHDPSVQHLPFWLASAPMPRPPREQWETHPVYQQVKAGLDALSETMPGVQAIHPMYADRPDECRYLMDQTFYSNTFCTTADVTDYQNWWVDCDKTVAFEYYRQALQLIANGDQRTWVLKDPAHLFCLDAIFKVFPDACIVHTHRDPFEAMASTTNLTYLIRKLREPALKPEEVGAQVLRLWGQGLKKAEEARSRYGNDRILDLHMLEVRRDPLRSLERIYEYFGLPINHQTLAIWQHQLEIDPNQEHGVSRYIPEQFGFSRQDVQEVVEEYYERYMSLADCVLSK
jgi:Sulfotransferase family